MKTGNYLGMTSHIAPPHTKHPRPHLSTRAGVFSLQRRAMARLNG